MPGQNLSKSEAFERSSLISAHTYNIEIDLRQVHDSELFRTSATILFDAGEDKNSFIDVVAESVISINLNGQELDPTEVYSDSRIELPALKNENKLQIVADFAYTNSGEGLHKFVDPVDGEVYLYSQFEVPDSRRVFPVFEQPDLKANFQFTVHGPKDWQVISNQPTPRPSDSKDHSTWIFEETPRISSYITALIAGPYHVVRSELISSSGKTVPLGIFCRRSLQPFLDADYLFEVTKAGFSFFESKFKTPFPFAKYDQLFVPEFNAGAMENAGAVTFTESYIFRSKVSDAVRERRVVTVLHELAHMWFGDLVTMKWWNDLWLNESFAEWASTLATAQATEWSEAWTTFQAMEKSWAYRQDQLPTTHPIVAKIDDLEDVQVNFDGITYAKGGSVLKQLVAWVGETAFFEGLRLYFKSHQWGNAELVDLLKSVEKSSDKDLQNWSRTWLETAGVNTLCPRITEDPMGLIDKFYVDQTASTEWPTLRPHRLAIGFYDYAEDGFLERIWRTEVDVDGAFTNVESVSGKSKPPLILVNDDDMTYAKIRLDPDSLSTAISHLSKVRNPLARSLIWGSLWDATRDAEFEPQKFIDLVLSHVAKESESTSTRIALGQLAVVVRNFSHPRKRSERITLVGSSLWELAQKADPGSDSQFQLVKAFSSMASTSEHSKILRSLREGTSTLPGLSIDTDLSWELLSGIALCGATDSREIDEALSNDNTSNGQQAAAKARAMLPAREDKKRAFDELVSSPDLPNSIVRAVTAGLNIVNDQASLEPLVDSYFACLNEIWSSRSYKIAEYLVEGLYPGSLVSENLAERSQHWIANNRKIPALRRIVEENAANVERALRVQKKDE